jgi:hypothetical protein
MPAVNYDLMLQAVVKADAERAVRLRKSDRGL